MADPFEALRAPVVPTDPEPTFAARLRARIEQALDEPGPAPPSPAPAVVPYLAVAGAEGALDWYVEALGARLRSDPVVMPDGRIGHAELELEGGVLMLADEHPEIGVVAPRAGQGATVTLHLSVADVDRATARAVDAGATLERPPADHPYGRNAVVRDPFGHRWLLASAPATTAAEAGAGARPGDIAYVSLWVPDVERAAAFFSTVLAWTYAPASGGQGRQVVGRTPAHGLWGGQPRSTLFLCFAVHDLDAAVMRARDAGGEAGAPRVEPYGRVADCADDQGLPFALVEVTGGPGGGHRPVPATGHGDLAYVTIEVVDSARARSFFGSVLGWRFSPGQAEDGWAVEGVVPMTGMAGGHDRPTVVPMYRVDDIADAVERVRASGGRASDPERQPYGLTSTCTDDQGTRFYLGQL
ncbi:MAG TPA: VOC family protein [Acidimicrobiales bacterium]|nr:VOC family protein [Acidimicrobiales bacterium]